MSKYLYILFSNGYSGTCFLSDRLVCTFIMFSFQMLAAEIPNLSLTAVINR